MSKDNVEKVQAKVVDVNSKLEFARKVDSGTLIMSLQKDLIQAKKLKAKANRQKEKSKSKQAKQKEK